MTENSIRVILAGGGTGGHIFPAIAIANAIRKMKPDSEILFVGAIHKMEMEMVPEAGYAIEGLDIAGLQHRSLGKNLSLPLKLLKSLLKARKILKEFRPHVVIGTGGYASFPVLFMAALSHIPVLIQEQNSYAGKANRMLGRKAARICVAYEGMEKFFPKEKIVLTGNPVRTAVTAAGADKESALLSFGLDIQNKTVLAVGGSLGAKSINEALDLHLDNFRKSGVQLIWQTGKSYFSRACQSVEGYEKQIKVFEFIQKMNEAYHAADVVISRAGAVAISELCLVGKPAVLVPYPFAAEDHQTHNALSLVHRDAALMVRDSEASEELVKKTFLLLENDKMQEILAGNLSELGRPDADIRIAKEALGLAGVLADKQNILN